MRYAALTMTIRRWFVFAALSASPVAVAGDCDVQFEPDGRAGRIAALVCADGLVEGDRLRVAGPSPRITYHQYLKRCAPDDKRRGIYAVLEQSAGAASGLELSSGNGEVACRADARAVADALSSARDPAHEEWWDAMPESEARYIDVGGIRTRYFDQGRGEVVVLVHGGQPSAADFNAREWQQNVPGLADRFRVIVPDRVGQGRTANPGDLEEYKNYYPLVVEHLLGFLRALGLERVHLVGHSQGGWPVTRLAIDHPELVASVTIVDSTMVTPAENAMRATRFYLWHTRYLHPADGETPESIRRGMRSFSHTGNHITDQRVERIHALAQQPKYRAARAWFERSLMSPAHPSYRALKAQIWDELRSGALRVPTLIVWGLEDPEDNFDAGLGLFRALADAGTPVRYHAFAAAGHVPYMEYPEAFNEVLSGFIRSTGRPARTR